MPGYTDPDNRQPLWWATGDPLAGANGLGEMMDHVDELQRLVLDRVAALANARAEHPAMIRGDTINWWSEPNVYAYARSSEGDHMIALFNRTDDYRALTNGLTFAGLPSEGRYVDIVTGDVFTATNDQITVDLNSNDARVLVYSPNPASHAAPLQTSDGR
jgi:hypothetical protein